jgi:hypothetical protein
MDPFTNNSPFCLAWLKSYIEGHSLAVTKRRYAPLDPEKALWMTSNLLSFLTKVTQPHEGLGKWSMSEFQRFEMNYRELVLEILTERYAGVDAKKLVSDFESDYAAKCRQHQDLSFQDADGEIAVEGSPTRYSRANQGHPPPM